MPWQMLPQWSRLTLVEEDERLRNSQRAARSVLQDFTRLRNRDTREPLDKLLNRRAVFEVLEQRCDGNSRTLENPCSTNAARVVFDSRTGGSVDHEDGGSTGAACDA